MAHAHHEERRDDEAHRVADDGVRRGDGGDERAGRARAADLRDGDRELQLRVPVDEVLAVDEGGEVRLISDVEEDGEDPDEELKDEQVPDLQHAREPEDRDEREQNGARRVADDEDPAAAQAIDPDARGEGEEDEGEEAQHAEERELDRARVQVDRGEPRDGELRDLRSDLADRLARPELEEVRVRPEATRRAAEPRHSPACRGRRRARAARLRRSQPRGSRRRGA